MVNYFDPAIDGVVVAGGNGSFHETVTGMFRQKTNENVDVAALPIGFIPLGKGTFLCCWCFLDGLFV